jgi:hypothetical protein
MSSCWKIEKVNASSDINLYCANQGIDPQIVWYCTSTNEKQQMYLELRMEPDFPANNCMAERNGT